MWRPPGWGGVGWGGVGWLTRHMLDPGAQVEMMSCPGAARCTVRPPQLTWSARCSGLAVSHHTAPLLTLVPVTASTLSTRYPAG